MSDRFVDFGPPPPIEDIVRHTSLTIEKNDSGVPCSEEATSEASTPSPPQQKKAKTQDEDDEGAGADAEVSKVAPSSSSIGSGGGAGMLILDGEEGPGAEAKGVTAHHRDAHGLDRSSELDHQLTDVVRLCHEAGGASAACVVAADEGAERPPPPGPPPVALAAAASAGTGNFPTSPRGARKKKRKQDPPGREPPKDYQNWDNWPSRDALSFTRSLVFYGTGSVTEEHEAATRLIQEARAMRRKYHGGSGVSEKEDFASLAAKDGANHAAGGGGYLDYAFGPDGVVELYRADSRAASGAASEGDAPSVMNGDKEHCDGVGRSESASVANRENLCTVPNIDEFVRDYNRLVEMVSEGAMRTFCFQRLQMLSSAFKMHTTANGLVENEAQSNLLGTDFYRTMKVDNHIHLAAAASAKQFVNFVRDKLHNEGDTVVLEDGSTLRQVFANAGLDTEHLTIDAFNVLADYSVYQRFDNFNSKYSPFRMAQMRKIFLKVDNHIHGRYFAELTKIVLARHEASKGHNSAAEMRLSIYGMEREEWLHLARWVLKDWQGGDFPGPVLSSHNRWLVQVPRLWRIYCAKGGGQTRSYQEMLENLFCPIFEATLYPEQHPEVAELLKHIVGFDSVDDEGNVEAPCSCSRPLAWKKKTNPAYCWQLYYLWANIEVLNRLRKAKGLNTFAFRPHAGETGDVMHLAATYMMCTSINHGINLDRQVALQYLYYLDQVGLSVSPLSNNFLFRKISSNPFPKLFRRGLNVTLSTDDPLLFHMSDDALLEEYSVARASFDLSMTDISEIARNSVLQSGFEPELKKEWLGENYSRGVTHCDENKTHVPLIRAKFRAEHLALEHMLVALIAAGKGEDVLKEMMTQFSLARDAHRKILVDNFMEVPPSL